MMVSRQELKRRAKLQLGGGIFTSRWLMALVVCLVQELLLSVGSIPGAITNGIQIFRSSGSILEALSGSGAVDASSVSISITPLSGLGTIVWLLLAGPSPGWPEGRMITVCPYRRKYRRIRGRT